jgi:hypothetical protein
MISLRWSQVEAIKWCALVAMVADHLNSIVLQHSQPVLSVIGRAAFPAFAFAIAYGFVRGAGNSRVKFERLGWRLLLVGLISQPVTVYVRGDAMANIMFTFLVGLSLYFVLEHWVGALRLISIVLLLAAGSLVEYHVAGVVLVFACCYLIREGTFESWIVWLAALCLLVVVNGNAWGFLVVPLVLGASGFHLELPRIRGFFYSFYPIHFLVLAAVPFALGYLQNHL